MQRKRKKSNPIESAMSNFNATVQSILEKVHNVPQPEKHATACSNLDQLFGTFITAERNELSPKTVKKKRKKIMQFLIDENSDTE